MNSIPVGSLDLAVSLGVLRHIPDTALAIFSLRLIKLHQQGSKPFIFD